MTSAARRKALDSHRRATALRNKLPLLIEPAGTSRSARVTRAKKKISGARIPYRVPDAHELPERLDAVLTAVHLVFTAGHTAATGDTLVRPDLVAQAIELCRGLADLMPDEREVRGLLALMLLTDARRATRVDTAGAMVLLEDQVRSRWDHQAIEQGRVMVLDALRGGNPGRFVIQAAIAALHAVLVPLPPGDASRLPAQAGPRAAGCSVIPAGSCVGGERRRAVISRRSVGRAPADLTAWVTTRSIMGVRTPTFLRPAPL